MSEYDPTIVGLLCNWCTYTGADLAGTSRIQYPPNVRIIRLMCSGGLDPVYVSKALLEGADGVLIGGCHPGDCHYRSGNIKAMKRMKLLNRMLGQFGINPARVKLDWVAAGEAEKFVEVVNGMAETIAELGPLSIKGYVNKEALV